MSKKKKKVKFSEKKEIDSVESIIAEDKNNIEDATEKAMQNIDNMVVTDNIEKNDNDIKSIRELNIEEKNDDSVNNENTEITSENSENLENLDNSDNLENSDNNQNDVIIESSDNTKEAEKPKKSHKTFIIVSCIIVFVLLIALLFSTVFALVVKNTNTIINGIYINDVDVSNLTEEESIKKLSSIVENKLSNPIVLKHNDYKLEITPKQLEVNFDLQDAVNVAYSRGRNGNIFKNNYDIIISSLAKTKINPGFSFSEEILNALVKEMEENFPDLLVQSSYSIEENNLILSKGKDGVVIDKDELKNQITYIITNLNLTTSEIDIPTISKKADKLDLNKIHSEVAREPKNAYYTTSPFAVYPHEDGIDFKISLEEAIAGFNNSTEEKYSIELKVISPEITANDLGNEAFPDELASYSTTFSTSNVNRSTNIRLATEKINGTVVMPGEIFSYNATVGERTAAKGYKAAGVYVGGQVTTGIGGGICQVSSTLYNAVLLSNLEIVARYNHCFNPGYVPVSRDATVSWGGPDFKFKNTRNYPIKIICSSTNGKEYVQIRGLKEEDEYEVEIQSYVTKWIGYSTITRNDSSLPKGETKVIESGSNGCKSVAYRILKKDGKVISKDLLSQDVYDPHNRIIAVGTAE